MHQLCNTLSLLSLPLSLFLCGLSIPYHWSYAFLITIYFVSATGFTCTHSNPVYLSIYAIQSHPVLCSPPIFISLFPPTLTPLQRENVYLYMSHYLPWLDISCATLHILPIMHWMASLPRPSLLAPTPLSPPFSLYLARKTSFPPWVQQTPVWIQKVEGEVVEAEDKEEEGR